MALPLDIVVAPARAFAEVAAHGAWLPAYGVLVILGLTAGFLEWPALAHVAAAVPDAGGTVPRGAAAIAASNRTVLANVLVGEALTPLIFIGLTATVLTVIARFKATKTHYSVFVALAAACLIPSSIGDLLGAGVIRVHDPASYHDYRSIFLALPDNLGVFAGRGNERELFFLSRFGIFDVWSYALLAFGIAALVPVRFMTAVAVAFSLYFFLSLLD
ncbi:MAG: hypothetical protein IAI50_12910 [Candidatus Eremiobacteraeota bacterium]|nr:hypothetical protein [Candidatus Eremiobacteraeota bacterium]